MKIVSLSSAFCIEWSSLLMQMEKKLVRWNHSYIKYALEAKAKLF